MAGTSRVAACAALLGMVAFGPARVVEAAKSSQTEHQQHHPASPQETKPGMQGKMTMDCQSVMAAHQKVMEEMKASDTRLDTLVQTMTSATGQAKVDATAAVVAELVSQRKTMRERMTGMQGSMMQHMAEHMQAGGGQGPMQCPMMKNMPGPMKQP